MKESIRTFIPYIDYLALVKMRINKLFISDEKFIKQKYKETFGKELNIEKPQTFNEKIKYRILKDRKKIFN